MVTESIADRDAGERERQIAERVARGLDHYSQWSEEIVWKAPGVYMIPKSSGGGHYRILLKSDGETCNCPDLKGHSLGVCKHTICALVAGAKHPTYRVEKAIQGDVYELVERRAGLDRVIGWGNVAEMYWSKWAIENPEWDDDIEMHYSSLERMK